MNKTPRKGPQQDIAVGLLERFPNLPTLTLAKMAYKANPAVWTSLDTCRAMFRRMRGNCGAGRRATRQDKRFFRPNDVPADPFGKLPDPLRDIADWKPVVFVGPMKVLCLSDVHIPYYDKSSLVCALTHGAREQVDTILLNGDTCDFYSISMWEIDPRKRKFSNEIRAVKDFFATLRDVFHSARIIFKCGNHEDRLERYMWVKAPELLDMPQMEIEGLLGLSDWDIQAVKDHRPMTFGKLNVIHGHEYRFAISNPVNPARGLFLRTKAHAACGHFHQSSQHSEGTLELNTISTWSMGCLCDLHPRYRPLNNWNHGFMYFEVDKSGAFEVRNLRIVHGKAY